MQPHDSLSLTPRRVVALAASSLLARAQGQSLTARQVIERIQRNIGVPWRTETVDTFKAGNPDSVVKGIATTFLATLDVLQRAAASGNTLVIAHEPTFYNHQDSTKEVGDSAVYRIKQEFIEKHGMVVWRFHDHWHMRRPDGISAGMAESLGWEKYKDAGDPRVFAMPATTTLASLAKQIQGRLNIRTLRVIGDPQLRAARVALNPGFNDLRSVIRTLDRDDVDVLVIGESREWEGTEYARDAVTAGRKKGLIVMGHVPSEEGGMKECARWLRTFVTEVPVKFIPAGEPFWSPQ
jgi:putative NIF3 family GTP cyclohydrolase 1 type 2